jgi:hypothetical protein
VSQEPTESLHPYYRNPRRGDVPAIAKSLQEFGQFRPIVVNRGTKTGRPNEILAGNHTYYAAVQIGLSHMEVDWVDVDEETAAKIVLIDNRTADLSGYDAEALEALVRAGYDELDDFTVTKASGVEHHEPEQAKAPGGEGYNQFKEGKEKYDESGTRHLFLEWPVGDYEAVEADLGRLRELWSLESNGDVVRELLS